MYQQSAVLTFPKALIDRPVMCHLIREVGVDVNILQATVTPDSDGRMFVIFRGSRTAVRKGLEYLEDVGVRVVLPARNLVWNERRCVHCTACVGQCPSAAFTVEEETHRVVFNAERCIACELCIPACGYGAVESISDYLKRTGELA